MPTKSSCNIDIVYPVDDAPVLESSPDLTSYNFNIINQTYAAVADFNIDNILDQVQIQNPEVNFSNLNEDYKIQLRERIFNKSNPVSSTTFNLSSLNAYILSKNHSEYSTISQDTNIFSNQTIDSVSEITLPASDIPNN